jgi:predicted transcriptional regulator YheO
MNRTLEAYKGLISFLGEALPEEFDAVLFDLTDKRFPVIEKSDWVKSGEELMRKAIADNLKNGFTDGRDFVLNSITATKDKRLLKMNIFYIKEEGRPVGALVLNMEMDFFLRMSSFLNERLMTEKDGDSVYLSGMPSDPRARRAEGLDAIDSVIRSFGPPAEKMTPSERKEVFIDIYDTGVFKLKGAIPRAAEALKVSEKTIYRYLSEIKKGR